MLTASQLHQIRSLLTSDRLHVSGTEVLVVAQLIAALQKEEAQLLMKDRLKPIETHTLESA